jgi:hypothetical protein
MIIQVILFGMPHTLILTEQTTNHPTTVCRTADPAAAPRYTTELTAATFYLNTTPSTFDEAEIACQTEGGHLASYSSFEEQVEVESFYLDNYYLMAPFHKQYWMGYKAKIWGAGNFEVLDTTMPKDPAQNLTKLYFHWGNMTLVLPNKSIVVGKRCMLR